MCRSADPLHRSTALLHTVVNLTSPFLYCIFRSSSPLRNYPPVSPEAPQLELLWRQEGKDQAEMWRCLELVRSSRLRPFEWFKKLQFTDRWRFRSQATIIPPPSVQYFNLYTDTRRYLLTGPRISSQGSFTLQTSDPQYRKFKTSMRSEIHIVHTWPSWWRNQKKQPHPSASTNHAPNCRP